MVRRHIQTVVSAAPAKAIATLENDAHQLISAGMVNLTAKLSGIDDDKLINRVVEVWGFFWDQVLPYVEGVGTIFTIHLRMTPTLTRFLGTSPSPDRPYTFCLVSYS